MPDSKKTNQGSPAAPQQLFSAIQGHRGCRGLMPENTIPAFIKALELGVATLEVDASITADSVVILSHEPFFNHEITTKPNGGFITEAEERGFNMYRMPFREIQRYDVGLKPHPRFADQQKIAAVKPALADVIDSVKAWCVAHQRPLPYFNIETKCMPETDGIYHPRPRLFVDLIMKVIVQKGIEKQTIIQSFDFRSLQYLHQAYPLVKTAALVENENTPDLDGQLAALGFVPSVYSPAFQLVTPAMVERCRTLGMELVPWTVNSLQDAVRLKEMGVKTVITDFPDRIY